MTNQDAPPPSFLCVRVPLFLPLPSPLPPLTAADQTNCRGERPLVRPDCMARRSRARCAAAAQPPAHGARHPGQGLACTHRRHARRPPGEAASPSLPPPPLPRRGSANIAPGQSHQEHQEHHAETVVEKGERHSSNITQKKSHCIEGISSQISLIASLFCHPFPEPMHIEGPGWPGPRHAVVPRAPCPDLTLFGRKAYASQSHARTPHMRVLLWELPISLLLAPRQ